MEIIILQNAVNSAGFRSESQLAACNSRQIEEIVNKPRFRFNVLANRVEILRTCERQFIICAPSWQQQGRVQRGPQFVR